MPMSQRRSDRTAVRGLRPSRGEGWPFGVGRAALCLAAMVSLCAGGARGKEAAGPPGGEAGAVAPPASPRAAAAVMPDPWRQSVSCGANCVYVLLRVLEKPVSYEEVSRRTKVGLQGSTMDELARVANLYGVRLAPMRATRKSVEQWPLPAIIHQQEGEGFTGHYVLYLGRDPNTKRYVTLDCTTGQIAPMEEGDFFNRWSGYVLLRSPTWGGFESWVARAWLIAGVFFLGFGVLRWFEWSRGGRVTAPPAADPAVGVA